ncbi:hypothetical protein [Vibrio sp. Vb1980]|uniref:hypothetical protein n=1 Tax=Vibrio sp. Vb1980 TaxID=3074646 RepID=UPI00296495F4|nr:hypothetical protein [Vibrio sp. Vb1980]MDW1975664.1 hypothetical protein [Vibrio sp. Vb1980]
MYTKKTDWMNDYLASSDYYVSDHQSYSDKLALPAEAKVSLRFIGNIKSGYIFLLVINAHRSQWRACVTPELREHLNHLNMITGSNIALLLFSDDCPDQFGVVESSGNAQKLDTTGLKQFFGQFNQEYLQNLGDAKPRNKTYNDYFQAWTINNLSRYLTVNDIDAFSISLLKNRLNLIELKRPNEPCSTWLPYVDDAGNYKAGNWMSSNLKNTYFKTVAYNAENMDSIVFLDVSHIQRNELSGYLFRGTVQAIDFESLACMQPMEHFASTRVRRQHY